MQKAGFLITRLILCSVEYEPMCMKKVLPFFFFRKIDKENEIPVPKYKRDLVHKLKILKQDFQSLQNQGGHCRLEVSREEIFEVRLNFQCHEKTSFKLKKVLQTTKAQIAHVFIWISSRKHLRTKVTPDFHLEYSKNGGISIKSYVVDV